MDQRKQGTDRPPEWRHRRATSPEPAADVSRATSILARARAIDYPNSARAALARDAAPFCFANDLPGLFDGVCPPSRSAGVLTPGAVFWFLRRLVKKMLT